MRTPLRFVKGLVASVTLLAILASAASSQAYQPTERVATVLKVKGTARIMVNGKPSPILVGQELKPGTDIQTGADGAVDLRLGDSGENAAATKRLSVGNPAAATIYRSEETAPNVLHVFENTIVGIQKLMEMETGGDKISETELNLKAGKILANVKKLSHASHYEVKLPTGVAGIRGSTAVIGADGTIIMLSGSAVISLVIPLSPGSSVTITQTFTVGAGEAFNPALVIAAVQKAAAQANGGIPPSGSTASPAVIAAAQGVANTLANMPPNSLGSPVQPAPNVDYTMYQEINTPTTLPGKDNTIIFVSPK